LRQKRRSCSADSKEACLAAPGASRSSSCTEGTGVRRCTPSPVPHTRRIPSNEAPKSCTAETRAARGGVAFPAPPHSTACCGSARFCRRLAGHWGHWAGRLSSRPGHKAFKIARFLYNFTASWCGVELPGLFFFSHKCVRRLFQILPPQKR